MARCHRVVVRNTFLQVVPPLMGDALWRVSRSAGPRAKADRLPIILEEAPPADEPEQCVYATPWSSVCGDWGYQNAFMSELATDVLLEAAPVDELWGWWSCEGSAQEEVWVDAQQDLWMLAAAPVEPQDMEEFKFIEDEGKPVGGSGSPPAGSYLAALLQHIDAPCFPGGSRIQPNAGGCRLVRPRVALDKATTPFLKSKLAQGTLPAKKLFEPTNAPEGDAKGRRRGKRGGRNRHDKAGPRASLNA
jgi:hypothetical protein